MEVCVWHVYGHISIKEKMVAKCSPNETIFRVVIRWKK